MIIRGHTTLIEKKRQAREPRSTAQTWKQSVIATLVKAFYFGCCFLRVRACVFVCFPGVCVTDVELFPCQQQILDDVSFQQRLFLTNS